ncbi:MAG: alpha-galactosidase [Solobacterium sp.]|nr:alpha-galactosidase [Solobacterium sp.]
MNKPVLYWFCKYDNNGRIITREGREELGTVNHITIPVKGKILAVKGMIDLSVKADEFVFMNGFQTWTHCPEYIAKEGRIRGLIGIPRAAIRRFRLDRYGNYHFVDYAYRRGVLHGESWCSFRDGETYRLFASLDETPGYTLFRYDWRNQLLTVNRDCEGIVYNGNYPAFDLFVMEGKENEVYDAWFSELGVRPLTEERIAGYSSWYNRYQNISEQAIRQDLNGCARILKEGDLFQIDDGWEPFVGDWLEADPVKFPHGMKAAADAAHAKGYKAGLWLAPFVAETNSSLYKNHPDWFLKHNGKPWCDGSNWSSFYSLDIDHPEVIAYLEKVFDRVFREWGYDLVKLDFLYAAAPFGTDTETRAARMIRANKLLRKWCEGRLILGCGVPVMTCFGMFEYCRISCDVTLDWNDKAYMQIIHRERPSTKNAMNNIVTRRMLNHRAYLSDPDVFFLREENCTLTPVQKHDLAVLDALLGGVFLTSDDPSSYTDEMVRQYREYRKLTEAKVLEVRTTNNAVYITYMLDGIRHTATLFEGLYGHRRGNR